MNDQRSFEDDLKATLDALAGPPASPELLARVAAIPEREPHRPGLIARVAAWAGLGRPLAGIAAAALVVVLAAGLLGLLGRLPGIGGLLPSRSPSPSASATAPVANAATPILTATPAPRASGTPTPAPTLAGPSGVIPADFTPLSVTFVSADQGWAFGGTACGAAAHCAVIVETRDGGRSWTRVAAPATTVGDPAVDPVLTGVSGLRFADPLDGWAFGPDLWATHDGGTSWHHVTVPGGAGTAVMALEAHAGRVHAAVSAPGAGGYRIATSPVGGDAWTLAPPTLAYGAGPVPQIQLVLSGNGGWLLEVDRAVIGGLRLGPTGWSAWQPPCLDVNGPAVLAASSAADVVAACDEGVWGPAPTEPTGGQVVAEHLYRSADGGTTFARSATTIPLADVSVLAAATPSLVVAAGSVGDAGRDAVISSRDGGRTWATSLVLGSERPLYLGFTTATQGVLITDAGLRLTYDGGRTWQLVRF